MPTHKIVLCPKCNTRLKVSEATKGIRCVKCDTRFAASAAKTVTTQRRSLPQPNAASPRVPETLSAKPTAPPAVPLSLVSYVRQFHRSSRGSLFLWVPLAMLVVFFSSLLKPVIGSSGFVKAALLFGIVFVVAHMLFVIAKMWQYAFGKQRRLPSQPRSRLAKLGYFAFFMSLGLFGLAIAERYSPANGFAATKIQPLAQVQDTVLGWLPPPESDASDGSSEDSVDTASDSVAQQSPGILDSVSSFLLGEESDSGPASVQDQQQAALESLQPKPVQSWQAKQPNTQLEQKYGFNGNSSQIPTPGGSFSAKLTSMDAVPGSNNASSSSTTAGPFGSAQSQQVTEAEASLGFDGRSAANLIERDSTPEPGGAFTAPIPQ